MLNLAVRSAGFGMNKKKTKKKEEKKKKVFEAKYRYNGSSCTYL